MLQEIMNIKLKLNLILVTKINFSQNSDTQKCTKIIYAKKNNVAIGSLVYMQDYFIEKGRIMYQKQTNAEEKSIK
jgi:hypothetical protein